MDNKIAYGRRRLKYNGVIKGGDNKLHTREVDSIFENDEIQTVVLCDGINYPNNVATIVRNGSILGLTSLFVCPISKQLYLKIHKEENKEYSENYLKSFKIQNGNCIYTNKFIKSVSKYSVQHHTCLNIFYNYQPLDIIDKALEKGFDIYMLENNVKGDIINKNFSQKKVMFIVGNERFGVRESIIQLYPDGKISPLFIPSCIDKTSMNVSNAATIAIYERNKQAKCNPTECGNKVLINLVPSTEVTDKNLTIKYKE